jgi:hypothetical protein
VSSVPNPMYVELLIFVILTFAIILTIQTLRGLLIRQFSTKGTSKSWVPKEDLDLQKITTQALIHEMSLNLMQSANEVVPWFLKNMPVSITGLKLHS